MHLFFYFTRIFKQRQCCDDEYVCCWSLCLAPNVEPCMCKELLYICVYDFRYLNIVYAQLHAVGAHWWTIVHLWLLVGQIDCFHVQHGFGSPNNGITKAVSAEWRQNLLSAGKKCVAHWLCIFCWQKPSCAISAGSLHRQQAGRNVETVYTVCSNC